MSEPEKRPLTGNAARGLSLFRVDKYARDALAAGETADRRARAASQRSVLALWFALAALVMAGAALAARIVETLS